MKYAVPLITSGDDAIRFPSSDGFEIRMEGFVEWSVIPDKLPLVYSQYGEGNELIPLLQEKVILPYARSFSLLGVAPGMTIERAQSELAPLGMRLVPYGLQV